MPNIKPFSLFPTLSDNLLSNRFDQIDRLFSQLTGRYHIVQFQNGIKNGVKTRQ